jgi:hypothetical protein
MVKLYEASITFHLAIRTKVAKEWSEALNLLTVPFMF